MMTPEDRTMGDPATFQATEERFGRLLVFAQSTEALTLTHGALEAQINVLGREMMRQLMADHFALRALEEARYPHVVDAAGIAHTTVEPHQTRPLETIFGPITVRRMAYRHKGTANLYPADGVANLPIEKYSHGLREIAAREALQHSYDATVEAIGHQTGQPIGKRQVEQLVQKAAQDVEAFYTQHPRPPAAAGHALVVSVDGKGIVMRRDGLRPRTAKVGTAGHKLHTRLSAGEKRGRKRMAEVGAVYDILPVPRQATDILHTTPDAAAPNPHAPAPKAQHKWLTASVVHDVGTVIDTVMAEAEGRDPHHERPWVALVDGNTDQLRHLQTAAAARHLSLSLFIDFIHVLEYLWTAAWCFFPASDPQAEAWVLQQGLAILKGQSSQVAAAMRRKATMRHLTPDQRKGVDRCADYLLHKRAFLDYPTALARGWPIATGIIEGACRHLIKDRFDITGARWSLPGAEAVLKLRAVWSNGDWSAYWAYHLAQEQQRAHATRYAVGTWAAAA